MKITHLSHLSRKKILTNTLLLYIIETAHRILPKAHWIKAAYPAHWI